MTHYIATIQTKLLHFPWLLLALILLISGIGFLMLYSAAGGNMDEWAMPQMVRFVAGLVLMFGIALMPMKFWFSTAYLGYAVGLVLLIIVEVSGHIGMGAQRWIDLGVIKLQPSEIAKITTILALARYFQYFPPQKYTALPFLFVPLGLIAVPVGLILKQPNLGTATLLMGISAWVMFAAGLHRRYFLLGILAVAIAAPIGWQSLHDYQKRRVMTFLDPEADPLGAGYNITQSMIAIGSGGLTGKGLMQGSQTQLDFLPEKQTDFIFTVLAEEFGFIGAGLLIFAYTLMIFWVIGIGYFATSIFGKLTAHGIAAMLSLHLFINTGMVMGILPVVGIPLPLLSYGGSIMLSIQIAFGLAMNVWIHRSDKLIAGRM